MRLKMPSVKGFAGGRDAARYSGSVVDYAAYIFILAGGIRFRGRQHSAHRLSLSYISKALYQVEASGHAHSIRDPLLEVLNIRVFEKAIGGHLNAYFNPIFLDVGGRVDAGGLSRQNEYLLHIGDRLARVEFQRQLVESRLQRNDQRQQENKSDDQPRPEAARASDNVSNSQSLEGKVDGRPPELVRFPDTGEFHVAHLRHANGSKDQSYSKDNGKEVGREEKSAALENRVFSEICG
jgi:hypothetical protein